MTDHQPPISHRAPAATSRSAAEPHGDGSMSNASTAGACDAVRGAYGQPGHIWLAATVETFGRRVDEWAENATDRARLAEIILAAPDLCASHEALRAERAALTARLAAVEGERDAAREELAKWASPAMTGAIAAIGQAAIDGRDMQRQRDEAQREWLAMRAERDAYHAALTQIAEECPIMNVVIDGVDCPCADCVAMVTVALRAMHPHLRTEAP